MIAFRVVTGLSGFAAALFRHANQSVHDQAHRRDRSVYASLLRKSAERAAGHRPVSQHSVFFRRQRAAGDAARRLSRVDRHAHGRAAARLWAISPRSLPSARRLFLYTIGWLLLLGKAGPVNYLAESVARSTGTGGQRLFAVRHDLYRVLALVAVCVSHAGGGFPLHGPVSGRSVGGLRRAGLANHAARFAALDAAGVLFGHAC